VGATLAGVGSNSKPVSTQPMVPFLSARTLFMPKRSRAAVPIMLRVLPAQLITTGVSGFRLKASAHKIKSPPGTLTPPGIQKRLYSSGVLTSKIIKSAACSCRLLSSSGEISGIVLSW
jgi:hypothetical protein